jgi:hypothetical protein
MPSGANFSVAVGTARKFWGACADGPGAVAGGFGLQPADRAVTLDVAADVRWTLAITPS